MVILNKVNRVGQQPSRAHIIYDEGDYFPSLVGCCPQIQEPRYLMVRVESPKVERHTHTLRPNIRRDWIDAAYTYMGHTKGPVCQESVDWFIWGF